MQSLPGEEEETPGEALAPEQPAAPEDSLAPEAPIENAEAQIGAAVPEPAAPVREDIERDDFIAFVGPSNLDKFLGLFDAQRIGRRTFRPCWPGVFIPQVWLMYRKLYVGAALAFALPIVLALFHATAAMQSFGGFCIWIAAGRGRYVYVGHARRTIARLRAEGGGDDEIRERLGRAGGVSPAGAWVGLAFTICALAAGYASGAISVHVRL